MAKVFKDAALIVGAAAAIVATAGAAAPAFAVGALASVGVTAGVSAVATGLALASAGLTALSALTTKAPKPVVNPMQWQSDPEAGLPIVAGRAYTGGKIVYRNTYQANNEAETIITVYSIGPVKEVEGLYVDSVLTTQTGITVNINDRGHMYASTQLGAQPEPKQLGDLGPPNYTTASKLSGLCASSVTFTYDTSGGHTLTTEPQVGYVIQGVRVYDPRKDSTYPGGSGAQRWNNETTWSYAGYDNPYLFALAWLIGWHQNGKLVAGVGVSTSAILLDQFVEGANVADANAWKMGGVLDSTDDPWSRLKDILQAGGGVPMRLGAQIGCIVNTPKTSLATIGVGDVVGDASVQATQAQRDRINAIVPRYMAELDNTVADPSQPVDSSGNHPLITNVTWAMVAASPVIVSDYVTFDGKQRQKQVDYTFVQNLTQSQQLARYDIENSREFGPITLPLKLRWMGYKPGDVVTCNLPELGLVGQDILLLQRELSPQDMTVTMTARSETYAKHAYALGQTGTPPATPSVSGPALIPTPGNAAWAITATQVSEGGSVYPGLVVTGAADSTVIDAIVFEYRIYTGTQADGDDWVAAGSEQPSTTTKPILILHDGAVCQAAVSYRKGPGTGTRLILGPETIGTTTIDFANIDGTTKTALLNEVSDAGTAAAAASAQLAVISSDGYLSRGEKPAVIQDWNAINAEYQTIEAQAVALGVDDIAYQATVSALSAYLTSLTPAWNDTTQDTAINAATFRGKFDDYYFAKISLTTAIDAAASKVATWDGVYGTGKDQLIAEAAQAASNAAAALTQLNAIASDGILSRGEKPAVILDWNAANNEVGALQSQAAQLGVSASAYTAAKAALDAYLGSLSPAWNDDTQDTAINGATFQGKFTDYYYARALLVNAMAQAAAQTASPTNLLRITLNERPGTAWSFGTKSSAAFTSNPATPGVAALEGVFYGRPYRQVTWTPKAIGDGVSILYRQAGLAPSATTAFRATPGDRLFWGATFLATGCTVSAAIRFFDGSFNVISTQAFGVPSTAAWPNSATGDFSSFRYGGFFTVPAGAVWGEVEMFGSGTSTAAANLVVTAPMVCSVPVAQTAWPAFVPGPNAVDGADPTGSNVALDTANVGGTPTQQVLGELQTAQTDIDNVTTTANATAAFTADVADNNHASPDEKKRYVVQVAQWQNDVTAEVAKGLSLGINAESTAYASAWSTFYNYLINTVQINNVSVSTYFDRSQFLSLSQAFTNAAQTLKNALKDQATKLTQDTTANVFLDPRFERPTDQTAWTGFDSRAVIQPIADGQRVQIPTGASSDINLYAFPVVMGPFDRIDVEFEVSVDSGVTSASLFGINFDGRDGAGNGYSQAGVLFLPTSVARGGWVTVKGSIYGSTYGANLASVLPHIVCQPLTGGNIYIRNPRGYRVPGSASNLNVNGRGTSALLNSTSIVAGIKVVNNTGFVLSSTPNGTSNVTVNIGAFTYTTDSGMTISYPAGSIPGLAFSTTYYVWRVDPSLNGGTSYGISTSLNDASKPGQLYVGYIITPSAAGTGGGGGGGGTDRCVTADMWVATDQGDVSAADIKPGDKVLCLTADLAGTEYAEVLSNEPATNWCIEITSASGVTLDLAVNTPMTPRSGAGGAIMAANVWAQDVAIVADGALSWEPCTIKALPDMPTVAQIDLGGRIFAAGKEKGRYLFSHNGVSKP